MQRCYRSIYEDVNKICEAIRKETNTVAVLRDPSPDSDDSGTGKGEKSTIPQVLMGDELQNVIKSNVLHSVRFVLQRFYYVSTLLHVLGITKQLMTEWGCILNYYV